MLLLMNIGYQKVDPGEVPLTIDRYPQITLPCFKILRQDEKPEFIIIYFLNTAPIQGTIMVIEDDCPFISVVFYTPLDIIAFGKC